MAFCEFLINALAWASQQRKSSPSSSYPSQSSRHAASQGGKTAKGTSPRPDADTAVGTDDVVVVRALSKSLPTRTKNPSPASSSPSSKRAQPPRATGGTWVLLNAGLEFTERRASPSTDHEMPHVTARTVRVQANRPRARAPQNHVLERDTHMGTALRGAVAQAATAGTFSRSYRASELAAHQQQQEEIIVKVFNPGYYMSEFYRADPVASANGLGRFVAWTARQGRGHHLTGAVVVYTWIAMACG
ncbi:hypothetical protein F5Y19DRAFT_473610 [Xylariaceae sp. FL1651]|nr:hypothetical protein F5Y19DRAFT_473610 [Xylariaceae sp. FL1651]